MNIDAFGDQYSLTLDGYCRMSQDGSLIGKATSRENHLCLEIERMNDKLAKTELFARALMTRFKGRCEQDEWKDIEKNVPWKGD